MVGHCVSMLHSFDWEALLEAATGDFGALLDE
jgi:hypothetical protein